MHPIIVSLYSDFPGQKQYANAAAAMKKRCVTLELDYHIMQMEFKSSWIEMCRMKPTFIYESLVHYNPRPILWVDVDCIINCKPVITKPADVAAPTFFENGLIKLPHMVRVNAIYFEFSKCTLKFLTDWITLCNNHPGDLSDHEYFSLTWLRHKKCEETLLVN
jgi:hypothetical protein